jgi:ketosteroid isomerase-like protein
MRIILSLTLLATVACATPLKGHQVNDNKLNREVAAVTDAYVGAMQARDAERVLALVADDYFEDLGNADSSDDYGRKELAKKLTERFEQTAELVMKVQLIEVESKGDTVMARMRFDVRYRLNLPSGSRWERHNDVNEIVLTRTGGGLKIKSGL